MSAMQNHAEAVWASVAAIPAGRVASYGQIAQLAGIPRHARLVGRILRELPTDTALPWHRVLRADGRIAFPEDSEKHLQQKTRLSSEGIQAQGGKVRMRDYQWQAETPCGPTS